MATGTISKEFTDIASLTKIERTVTTGPTGNIHSGYTNDGGTLVFGAYAAGINAKFDVWVSGVNNNWYLKARDADSGDTINNTSIALRFYVLRIP